MTEEKMKDLMQRCKNEGSVTTETEPEALTVMNALKREGVNAGYTGRPGLWQVVLLNGALSEPQVEYRGAAMKDASVETEGLPTPVWERLDSMDRQIGEVVKNTEELMKRHRQACTMLAHALSYVPQDEAFYQQIEEFLNPSEPIDVTVS